MPAPQSVIDLVRRFESQRAAYRAGKYNETQLRRYGWSAKLRLSLLTDFERALVPPQSYNADLQGEWDENLVTFAFKRPIKLVKAEREGD